MVLRGGHRSLQPPNMKFSSDFRVDPAFKEVVVRSIFGKKITIRSQAPHEQVVESEPKKTTVIEKVKKAVSKVKKGK